MLKKYLTVKLFSLLFVLTALCSVQIMAQTVVSGTVADAKTKEPLVGVSVQIKGKIIGTITDVKGKFSFTTSTPPPFTIAVTSIGYASKDLTINSGSAALNISLEEQEIMGQEVVVSASRFEEKVMKSPVTVEKLDLRAIRETSSPNFYDAIGNMKGVDLTTQGLLFKSINMRGFGATGNPRTVQMIDGMDNSAPGLNFPVDNIVGMPELDVESVEILPGASSALYGPNAINGLILMNSKSPFLYQGFSTQIKSGFMNEKSRTTATTPFYDLSMRYAKAWNNKVAMKFNIGYIGAKDWEANNYSNLNRGGVENGGRGLGVDSDYDGANIYGDEVQTSFGTVFNGLVGASSPLTADQKKGLNGLNSAGLLPLGSVVSRTGFYERDLIDYNTKSLKINTALHYRLSEKVELIGQANYGYGTTAYTGAARYSLKNFNIGQYKLELKGDNFNIRAYTTQERSGDSYASGLSAVSMLNEIKPHAQWFGEYVSVFAAARGAGKTEAEAGLAARNAADVGLPKSGSAQLATLADKYNLKAIKDGGGGFLDKSNLYHAEGIYNFKDKITFMDLSVGGNLRRYVLASNGTLFADNKEGRKGSINIDEYGGFIQAGKSLFKDHFKITASMRYDKNENFKGQFTPRIAGVISFGDHNFRASYQSGFRIPTTQNQYIDLKTASGTLIGGLPEFDARYKLAEGIAAFNLTPAVIGKFAADPEVQAKAQAYATAAVTAQATPLITAGVRAAITAQATPLITAGVNAAISAQVKAGVTAAITKAVTDGVTAFITKNVTDQVTAAVTKQVEDAIAAGQLAEAAKAAAIQGGIEKALPTTLEGALAANLQPAVNAQLPSVLATQFQPAFDSELAKALEKNFQPAFDAELKKAIDANFQTAFDGELKKALAANVPGVTLQVLPAFALQKVPKYQFKALQPEKITSVEIGYKGVIAKKLYVDAYHYWSKYDNFIGGTNIVVPTKPAGPGLPIESGVGSGSTRLGYSRPSNTGEIIKVRGFAANLNYSLGKGYSIGGNFAQNVLSQFKPSVEQQYAGFNTPKNRFNVNFNKRMGSGEKFGFSVNLRRQDQFTWESSFVLPTTSTQLADPFKNTIVPAITNLDAQISFKLTQAKSIIKIGATNIGSKPYFQAFGSPMVGSTYFVTINYDELFNR